MMGANDNQGMSTWDMFVANLADEYTSWWNTGAAAAQTAIDAAESVLVPLPVAPYVASGQINAFDWWKDQFTDGAGALAITKQYFDNYGVEWNIQADAIAEKIDDIKVGAQAIVVGWSIYQLALIAAALAVAFYAWRDGGKHDESTPEPELA